MSEIKLLVAEAVVKGGGCSLRVCKQRNQKQQLKRRVMKSVSDFQWYSMLGRVNEGSE